MPITGNSSYIPTMNEFLAHWGQVNAHFGEDAELVVNLAGVVFAREEFLQLRDQLQTQQGTIQDQINGVEIARAQLEQAKAAQLARLGQFNAVLEAYYSGTVYFGARPKAPSLTDGQEKILNPLKDMRSLWVKLNAAPAPPGVTLPLTLPGGLTVAQFGTALGQLEALYDAAIEAEQVLTLGRKTRDQYQEKAYAVMKAYRVTVPAKCAGLPQFTDTVPRLTPEPGSTPQPVNASAVFQAPDQAKVVYGASDNPNLAQYELRGNTGESYSENDAVVIANNSPEAPREFVTGFGLTQPGAKIALKVFVILTTGNEAGSEAMVVTRPAA